MNLTEAISHCRWKNVLRSNAQRINPADYVNKTFDEILKAMYIFCKPIKGLGRLTQYDLAVELARIHGINVDKVYIIGGGPKSAIERLRIIPKIQKIGRLKFRYVEIIDVINAVEPNILNDIKHITNGDILETYLCNWQKQF